MHAKLYHNKRPGIWTCPEDIKHIYNILSFCPNNLHLLQETSLRTEFDDVAFATPDLFSKICSNGSISTQLIANNDINNSSNGGTVILKMNGETNELSISITDTDSHFIDNNGKN